MDDDDDDNNNVKILISNYWLPPCSHRRAKVSFCNGIIFQSPLCWIMSALNIGRCMSVHKWHSLLITSWGGGGKGTVYADAEVA
jgi:hypothetical protein